MSETRRVQHITIKWLNAIDVTDGTSWLSVHSEGAKENSRHLGGERKRTRLGVWSE